MNPIGGISKVDLRMFIEHTMTTLDIPILGQFLHATPTAELEPTVAGWVGVWKCFGCFLNAFGQHSYTQSDEVDMGMSYAEVRALSRVMYYGI